MDLYDEIYGECRIEEPLLADLIESQAVQRLKGITMGGITALLGVSPPTTRYAHSVGAMLLVRHLGGSVPEQAAALLHDVSHTAFSHVFDFVFGKPGEQSFHDEWQARYVSGTDVPGICRRHGVEVADLLDEELYPILEQPLPRLCADRVDYSLRDFVPLGVTNGEEVRVMLDDLAVADGRMAFRSTSIARRFAEAYLLCDAQSWSNPRQVALYELCSRALKHAFERKTFQNSDIWTDDETLWFKLQTAAKADGELARHLSRVTAETRIEVAKSASEADMTVSAKMRWVDPDVVVGHQLVPLSSISSAYARRVGVSQDRGSKSIHVRIEPA